MDGGPDVHKEGHVCNSDSVLHWKDFFLYLVQLSRMNMNASYERPSLPPIDLQ